MINMLFARFHHIYTHRFESAYPDDDTLALAKREWSFALQGIPMGAVEATINKVRDEHAWPPTIAEFLNAVCVAAPSEDMPEAYDAYQEACLHANNPHRHEWRHPAVYWAAHRTGFKMLREGAEAQIWPTFRRHYQGFMLDAIRGSDLSLPRVRELEDQSEPVTSAAQQALAWCQDQHIEPAEVAHLLHYLELPAQSSVRQNFRRRALAQLEAMGITTASLPE
jgi:hypothetical protein